jgi:hypothetical protein
MKTRWNHVVIAFALAGATTFAPLAMRARPLQQPVGQREARAGTRRDIHQDTRTLHRQRRDIRRDQRQLHAARRTYGAGSPQARAVHRDIRHDKRAANRTRRDRNRDVRIHRRRAARAVKH